VRKIVFVPADQSLAIRYPLDRMMRTKKLIHTLDAAAEEHKPGGRTLACRRADA
jgi:hypothetical protein